MTRAVIYLRVSTQEQKESGAGIAAQEAYCRDYAGREGWEVVGIYSDEGLTGGKGVDERPGLHDALVALERGDVLLIAKRDRLAREMTIADLVDGMVRRRGARVVSAAGEGNCEDPDDPSHFLARKMADMLAQYERLVIKWRTRMALKAKALLGERTGGVPFGYDLVEHPRGKRSKSDRPIQLVTNEEEGRALGRLVELHQSGLTLRKIAATLQAEGHRTKKGGAWSHSSVQRILQRHGRKAS
jgi:DNA invertase Pin-like site-specific DNA recombinase